MRYGHVVKVWNQGVFGIGKSALESLLEALDKFDAAVFVFAPNDLVQIRGREFNAVRDNVVFELGLFTGRLGRDRTFWFVPQGQTQLRIASDLLGVQPAEYVEPKDRDWVSALAVPWDNINETLAESARSRGAKHPPLSSAMVSGCLPQINGVMDRLTSAIMSNAIEVSDGLVETLPDSAGFRVPLSTRSDLRVTFGRIEDCSCNELGSAIALPANEFFDDACITDRASALGAFVARHFGDRIDRFKDLVATERKQLHPALVEREAGSHQETYGVGTSVYLDLPLGSELRIILCAVTRKRAGQGIKAEPAYIFAGVQSITRIMNDKRLTSLHVPLLGSEHGDMASDVALLCLALALVTSYDIRHANIVVLRKTSDGKPEVPPDMVRRILAFVASEPHRHAGAASVKRGAKEVDHDR